jgi:hypothetical protein
MALLQPGGVYQRGNHGDVAKDLQPALPGRLGDKTDQNEMQDGERNPENNDGHEIACSAGSWHVQRPHHTHAEDKNNHEQADPCQPVKPLAHGVIFFHLRLSAPAPPPANHQQHTNKMEGRIILPALHHLTNSCANATSPCNAYF